MTTSVPLGTGSLVGNRFVFEEQIGRGGMGTVFKARDLRKEELQDPNPRVAIKILNEEFKRHPNALQALQREARKAQGIAHPNIVTVYDFDRDGADVYMTMELLEGRSLDRVIKDAAGVGVGFKEAFRILHDVCEAMGYAHARGVVHADFKPANVFLTRDGLVKVLDFGIARAVKRSDLGEGPHTLFDPGELNALTPAYAGYEVIEGQEPDVRDDIYAIACVFYELLTGKHPYGRFSADVAYKANLQAERPRELSRSQWQLLQSALAFRRDSRPVSAVELAEGLRPKRKAPLLYFGLAAAASVVIIGMLSSMHVMTYRDRAVSAALVSNNAAQIESVMPWLKALTPERRATIFLDDAARAGLVQYFMKRVDESVDPRRDQYNYAQADALIKELWDLLPDSQAVKGLANTVSARRHYAMQRERLVLTPVDLGNLNATLPDSTLKELNSLLRVSSRTAVTPQERTSADRDGFRSLRKDMFAEANTAALLAANADRVEAAGVTDKSAAVTGVSAAATDIRQTEAAEKAALAVDLAVAPADLRLAAIAAKKGRIEDALSLANNALQATPTSKEAVQARDRYARYVEIDDYLRSRERILLPHIRYKIWRTSKLAPDEMPAVRQRWMRDLNARIQAADDPKLVAHLSQAAQSIFGSTASAQPPLDQVVAETSLQE